MPRTKETPEIKAARARWRKVEDAMNPLPKVTEPENTALWEQQLWHEAVGINERKRAEDDYIEGVRRQARQKVIPELLVDATRSDPSLRQKAEEGMKLVRAALEKRRLAFARQRIINKLLADAHGRNLRLRAVWYNARRAAEHFFIERLLRIERQRIIDKLKKETP